jgi:hypothetical protein|tara:strand:- start:1168 stop:1485 length:318 start_codon:yes stop_codon:yes gene_type:complete
MTEEKKKEFTEGLIVKKPKENDPSFVKMHISIMCKDFWEWVKTVKDPEDDWLNIEVKESGRTGKWYGELNTWRPEKDGHGTLKSAAELAEQHAASSQDSMPDWMK